MEVTCTVHRPDLTQFRLPGRILGPQLGTPLATHLDTDTSQDPWRAPHMDLDLMRTHLDLEPLHTDLDMELIPTGTAELISRLLLQGIPLHQLPEVQPQPQDIQLLMIISLSPPALLIGKVATNPIWNAPSPKSNPSYLTVPQTMLAGKSGSKIMLHSLAPSIWRTMSKLYNFYKWFEENPNDCLPHLLAGPTTPGTTGWCGTRWRLAMAVFIAWGTLCTELSTSSP